MKVHHEFMPWKVQGTCRVVASEARWRVPTNWNRSAFRAGERRRVLVNCDLFEDWRGPMEISSGVQIWKRGSGEWTTSDHYRDTVALKMDDARRRLAQLVWQTPNLDWLFPAADREVARHFAYAMWFPDAAWPKNYRICDPAEFAANPHPSLA